MAVAASGEEYLKTWVSMLVEEEGDGACVVRDDELPYELLDLRSRHELRHQELPQTQDV